MYLIPLTPNYRSCIACISLVQMTNTLSTAWQIEMIYVHMVRWPICARTCACRMGPMGMCQSGLGDAFLLCLNQWCLKHLRTSLCLSVILMSSHLFCGPVTHPMKTVGQSKDFVIFVFVVFFFTVVYITLYGSCDRLSAPGYVSVKWLHIEHRLSRPLPHYRYSGLYCEWYHLSVFRNSMLPTKLKGHHSLFLHLTWK